MGLGFSRFCIRGPLLQAGPGQIPRHLLPSLLTVYTKRSSAEPRGALSPILLAPSGTHCEKEGSEAEPPGGGLTPEEAWRRRAHGV